jgi:hypothetical protein
MDAAFKLLLVARLDEIDWAQTDADPDEVAELLDEGEYLQLVRILSDYVSEETDGVMEARLHAREGYVEFGATKEFRTSEFGVLANLMSNIRDRFLMV